MSDGPLVIAQTEKFRIVRVASGNYVTEIYDECDALGVERWREAKLGEGKANTITLMFRDYIISQAIKADKEQTS
jgi:hypothetical protein